MYFNLKSFLAIALISLMILACVVTMGYADEKAENKALVEQMNILVMTEETENKEIHLQRAFYHATLTSGNVLLESEDGNLWEFDNLKADENSEFVILFDENNNLLGLWQAA